MPRSAERLLAAIERIKPHVPPDDFAGFRHELAAFLGAVVPAIETASSALRETTDHDKQNNTPFPSGPLSSTRHIAHAVMTTATLLGSGLWL
jgi:hypothetical protein